MNKKHLMIGNYLLDRENRLCKVEKIDKDGFKAPAIQGGITALPNEPIKLTEEWLIKLGFESNGDEDENEYYHNDETLFGVKLEVFTEQNKNCHIWDSAFTGAPIDYVHQLQNLYFTLTGKELN